MPQLPPINGCRASSLLGRSSAWRSCERQVKQRYREEVRKREAAETERGRLESQLKHAEARNVATQGSLDVRDRRDAGETRDTPIA